MVVSTFFNYLSQMFPVYLLCGVDTVKNRIRFVLSGTTEAASAAESMGSRRPPVKPLCLGPRDNQVGETSWSRSWLSSNRSYTRLPLVWG